MRPVLQTCLIHSGMRPALRTIDHLDQLMSSNDRIVVLTILSLSNLIDKDSLTTKEFCVRHSRFIQHKYIFTSE